MQDCNPTEYSNILVRDDGANKINAALYKQIVGSFMHIASTRPNIMHDVISISKYMENPSKNSLLAGERNFSLS